jgi:two-component system alkaline phosphatase synthesis response regulator PhoP
VAFQYALSTSAAELGHRTSSVTKVSSVAEVASRLHPDIVLLDIALREHPGQDARDALLQLKGNPATAGIPVLVYSSRPLTFEKRHVLELGAEDFILSPIEPTALMCKIERVVLRTSSGKFPAAAAAPDDSDAG